MTRHIEPKLVEKTMTLDAGSFMVGKDGAIAFFRAAFHGTADIELNVCVAWVDKPGAPRFVLASAGELRAVLAPDDAKTLCDLIEDFSNRHDLCPDCQHKAGVLSGSLSRHAMEAATANRKLGHHQVAGFVSHHTAGHG